MLSAGPAPGRLQEGQQSVRWPGNDRPLSEDKDPPLQQDRLLDDRLQEPLRWSVAQPFVVHTAIAVTVGVALFSLLPHRAVDAVVAAAFVAGAVYAGIASRSAEEETVDTVPSARGHVFSVFAVTSGTTLLRFVSIRRVRRAIAVILFVLAAYAA